MLGSFPLTSAPLADDGTRAAVTGAVADTITTTTVVAARKIQRAVCLTTPTVTTVVSARPRSTVAPINVQRDLGAT